MSFRRIVLLVLALGMALAALAIYRVFRPWAGFSGEVFVDLRRGWGVSEIADQLAGAGVIRSAWPFVLIRLARPGSRLKAGEYRFDSPLSPWEVYRKIERGEVFYYTVTIPEGHNRFEIAEVVGRTGWISRQDFLVETGRAQSVADLAPGAPSLEGFLFPDTYRVTRHTTAEDLVGMMVERFRQIYGALRQNHRPEASVLEVLALASLVEKETAVDRERPLVASVFRNRLRIGMPLQCDPTVIYALQLTNRWTGDIRKEDLRFPSAYNTYLRAGLPPGPIANPGRASLEAVLAPADTDYLYFVADGRGGHAFSSSLERHAQAVTGYRRAERRARRPAPPPKKHGPRR